MWKASYWPRDLAALSRRALIRDAWRPTSLAVTGLHSDRQHSRSCAEAAGGAGEEIGGPAAGGNFRILSRLDRFAELVTRPESPERASLPLRCLTPVLFLPPVIVVRT